MIASKTKSAPRTSRRQVNRYTGVTNNRREATTYHSRSQCAACDSWFNPYLGQREALLCKDCADVSEVQLELPLSNV